MRLWNIAREKLKLSRNVPWGFSNLLIKVPVNPPWDNREIAPFLNRPPHFFKVNLFYICLFLSYVNFFDATKSWWLCIPMPCTITLTILNRNITSFSPLGGALTTKIWKNHGYLPQTLRFYTLKIACYNLKICREVRYYV